MSSPAAVETRRMLGLEPGTNITITKERNLLESVLAPNPITTGSLTQNDLAYFRWEGQALGELDFDRERAIRRGVRYRTYEEISPLWLASATIAIPRTRAVEAAYTVAETMDNLVREGNITGLELLVSGVSQRAYYELCQYYNLPTNNTEALFDDNATLALYQFLGMTNARAGETAVTILDTGRVVEQTLVGQRPEEFAHNFRPALDVWQNAHSSNGGGTIGPFNVRLLNHFSDSTFKSDTQFTEEVEKLARDERPKIFIIPTATRSGRKLPFIDACRRIRNLASEDYDPIIILDDAQGLGRISQPEYTKGVEAIWDYADAVMATGAKVAGSLSGAGVMLINKERMGSFGIPLDQSPLLYRSRRYAFVSPDIDRVVSHNRLSPRLANTPEIASFTAGLQEIETGPEVEKRMQNLRLEIIALLGQAPGVRILQESEDVNCIGSIVSFYLPGREKDSFALKNILAQAVGVEGLDSLPITLPTIITTDEVDYLRISLDPRRVMEDSYEEILHYMLKRIIENIAQFTQTPSSN